MSQATSTSGTRARSGLWLHGQRSPIYKGGQHIYRVMCTSTTSSLSACRAARLNFGDLLVLAVYFQLDFATVDFNAFSYRYYNPGGMQFAGSLQDSSLAIMFRRFDEAING